MPFHSVTSAKATKTQKKIVPIIESPLGGRSILRGCRRRVFREQADALDHRVEAVAAVHRDVVLEAEALEHRARVEREDLARRAVRVQLEQQCDQALDDVRVRIAAQLEPRRRAGVQRRRQPHLRHAAAHLVRLGALGLRQRRQLAAELDQVAVALLPRPELAEVLDQFIDVHAVILGSGRILRPLFRRSPMTRPSGRAPDQLRPVRFERGYTRHAEGSVLVSFGDTRVLCTASTEERVPAWKKEKGGGWVTAEYGMLPRATHDRTRREAALGKQGGRTLEIQRLIGRALRSVVDLDALGNTQIVLDCDVLQADGGTRTAAITGGYVALADAIAGLMKRGTL